MCVIIPNNDFPRTDLEAIKAELNRIMSNHDKAIRQVDNNVLSEDGNEHHRQSERRIKCQCEENVAVVQVRKDGPNKDRLFASCESCLRFQWLDLPLCDMCGERMFQAQSRANGWKTGRWFFACPSRCQGSFKWLDRKHKGKGYMT